MRFWSVVLLIVLSQVWLLLNWGSLATSRSSTSNNDKIRKTHNKQIFIVDLVGHSGIGLSSIEIKVVDILLTMYKTKLNGLDKELRGKLVLKS